MKLELGMYCRTEDGYIFKHSKENNIYFNNLNNTYYILFDCGEYDDCDAIIKASHNIIDLIEVGDILHDKNDNEYWTVQRVEKDEIGNISIQTEWEGLESEEEFLDAIDEIITKEQAKNIGYKIGDE